MVNTIVTSFERVCVPGVRQTALCCKWKILHRTFCMSAYFPEYNKYLFSPIFLETYDSSLYLCKLNVIIFSNKFSKGSDSRKMQLVTNVLCAFQENEVRNYLKEYIPIRNHSSLLGPLLFCPYVSPKPSEDLIPTNSSNP